MTQLLDKLFSWRGASTEIYSMLALLMQVSNEVSFLLYLYLLNGPQLLHGAHNFTIDPKSRNSLSGNLVKTPRKKKLNLRIIMRTDTLLRVGATRFSLCYFSLVADILYRYCQAVKILDQRPQQLLARNLSYYIEMSILKPFGISFKGIANPDNGEGSFKRFKRHLCP